MKVIFRYLGSISPWVLRSLSRSPGYRTLFVLLGLRVFNSLGVQVLPKSPGLYTVAFLSLQVSRYLDTQVPLSQNYRMGTLILKSSWDEPIRNSSRNPRISEVSRSADLLLISSLLEVSRSLGSHLVLRSLTIWISVFSSLDVLTGSQRALGFL